ncbi:CalY family protein [Aneurinibacillus tyrosinisolvens]|uniref:CalY family protein n=1 Tax=Aneurinibacillus tyrosinisolvens TaxID=1443435 RepID=UPI00063F3E7A|nr:CalY family protein [Aneurinibacillus tyrosinisolvens]
MGIKGKIGMVLATTALGAALIGGGTFAYFNDTAQTTSKFSAGTLDLSANPTTIIDVNNIKPGDWVDRNFQLKNDGSLDIAKVLLTTDYKVTDVKGDNIEDFGKHIRVNFLYNGDKSSRVVYSTTLDQLKKMTPEAIGNAVFIPKWDEKGGLKAGTADTLSVEFEFVDNDRDQNQFQGDSLQLTWTFEGKQKAGEAK